MPLINLNLKKYYEMKAKCFNCGFKFILKIPHGIKAREHLDSGKAICNNCKTDDIAIDIPEGKVTIEQEEET